MEKFNPNYVLTVQQNTVPTINTVIKPPFTMEFDVHRDVLSSANVASIRIFNLSEFNRAEIRKDVNNPGQKKDISLIAGYEDNMGIIMSGQVTQAWSVREGVNFVTQIECFDAGYMFTNGQVEKSYPEGTLRQNVIDDIIGSMEKYGVKPGSISSILGVLPRGNSYSGNQSDILKDLGRGAFFIDNGVAHFLQQNEVTDEDIQVINPKSGLLGTPVREHFWKIRVDLLFDPRFTLGSRVQLESASDRSFNGLYKVTSIKHKGVISESVAGTRVTSLELFGGSEKLLVVRKR